MRVGSFINFNKFTPCLGSGGDWIGLSQLTKVRQELKSCRLFRWPSQNVDPYRWGIFLMDVQDTSSSVYMMKFDAHITLSGMSYRIDTGTFSTLKKWQQASALEVVLEHVKEGKVLGPFPGHTRSCPITGFSLVFYPSFVVPK